MGQGGHNAKLVRNIKILKLRFKDWRNSDTLRAKKDGSAVWSLRRIESLPGMPNNAAIYRICANRRRWVKIVKGLEK